MHDTKLGIGLATGMFFHAAAGTALPTYPTENVGGNGDGTTSDKFTATAAQVSFSLTDSCNAIKAFTIDGVEQDADDYSVSGTTVTWAGTTLDGGEKVVITYYVSAWRLVGDVTSDGITVNTDKSVENIRNWANVIKRTILSDHTETVQVPVMDTTEDALKTVIGADNVTVTPASGSHGKTIACNLSASDLPDAEAYLFVMKDGDDTMAVGMSNGQITAMESITFAPSGTINWTPTITAQESGLVFISEEG